MNYGNILSAAAHNGKFDTLKYLHENGWIFNVFALAGAASSGHFEMLKYLHDKSNNQYLKHHNST